MKSGYNGIVSRVTGNESEPTTFTPRSTPLPGVVRRPAARPPRRDVRTTTLYAAALLREFRGTLLALLTATVVGAAVFTILPIDEHGNRAPSLATALYAAWMALLAQAHFTPPPWHVAVINAVYPLLGFVLIGEGIVRLGLLMLSRRRGEKEWMNVKASTYRDHVVLAGLGHLGYRIFEQLHSAAVDVVVLEADDDNPFVGQAKALGAPVLIRDMQEDQSLIDAGVAHARAIVIAANRDMINLEVALDARRMNPKIRVLIRLYEQRLAEKIKGALALDVAFSSSSLAAPIVAAMSLDSKLLTSIVIAGVPHSITEIKVAARSRIVGMRVDEIERGYGARVLARLVDPDAAPQPASSPFQPAPGPGEVVAAGQTLVVHTPTSQLATLSAAAIGAG